MEPQERQDEAQQVQKLERARIYEEEFSVNIPSEERPLFHLPARIGWMNDPNGFSYYQGRYHLFYQYYPYEPKWGPMHWAHAVSDDLLMWEHLPCALAPDQPYDDFGCFSGSGLELADGTHMLMYTGVSNTGRKPDGTHSDRQVQCLAFGDGHNYTKYDANPVIADDLLPEGLTIEHFRDPKIWQEADGSFACVVGACSESGDGKILKYTSADGLKWEFACIYASNDDRFGTMWECPDTFELDGKQVLLVSPQDMLAQGDEFASGNGTLALIGHVDKTTGSFVEESCHAIDYGIDFYATQTTCAPDGRRIMVAWMQNWDTISMANNVSWFGQVAIPRELSVKDDRLLQQPVRELEALRSNHVHYERVRVEGERVFRGVRGRAVDLSVRVHPVEDAAEYREFAIWFAQDERFHSSIRFKPANSELKLNRKHSGLRRDVVHHRKCTVIDYENELKLRIILDRFSVEIFVGEGEQTLAMCIPTDLSADGICFFADGEALIDIDKYDLSSAHTRL